MYLKTLTVESASRGTIRQVNFRRGLNLIVDETGDEASRRGNNVGKTTALRCVDYCLGANKESLYLDDEWRTPNETVLSFLEGERPAFRLTLERTDSSLLEVVRRYGEKEWLVDETELAEKDAMAQLRSAFFQVEGKKPTFRQLIGKFVRTSPQAKTRVLKWLDPHTRQSEYEVVWLTLFGLQLPKLLNKRRDLRKQIDALRKQKTELERTAKAPRTERKVVEHALREARKELEELSIADGQEAEMRRLTALREELVHVGRSLAAVESRIADTERTLGAIEKATPRTTARAVRELFEDARAWVPDLQKRYEDLENFHLAMLRNKAAFVLRSRNQLETERRRLREIRGTIAKEEALALRACAAPDVWADVRNLNDRIARLSERHGWLKGLEEELKRLSTELETAQAGLHDVETTIQQSEESLESNVDQFNEFLSDYSERISELSSYLSVTFEDTNGKGKRVDARLSNIEGHEGSGEKRSQIVAFDLAYLRWQSERKARGIRFTLFDEIETADASHLREIFSIAEEIDGQFVLPILQDRLDVVDFDSKSCVVLGLSRSDRFFGI